MADKSWHWPFQDATSIAPGSKYSTEGVGTLSEGSDRSIVVSVAMENAIIGNIRMVSERPMGSVRPAYSEGVFTVNWLAIVYHV